MTEWRDLSDDELVARLEHQLPHVRRDAIVAAVRVRDDPDVAQTIDEMFNR